VQAVSPLVVCIAAQRRSEQALSPSAEAQTQTERYCFDWTTTSGAPARDARGRLASPTAEAAKLTQCLGAMVSLRAGYIRELRRQLAKRKR
jgi:hypothetical protein